MKRMVVLGGGNATRLGPLGGASKLSTSYAGRPLFAHHMDVAKRLKIEHVTFVLPMMNSLYVEQQIRDTYDYLTENVEIRIEYQTNNARGPIDALLLGTYGSQDGDQITVLMADTVFLEPSDVDVLSDNNTILVAENPSDEDRSWTHWYESKWWDGPCQRGEWVFIGAWTYTQDASVTYEGLVSEWLNKHMQSAIQHVAPSWIDVGDIDALASGNAKSVAARSDNQFTLTGDGAVQKKGPNAVDEGTAICRLGVMAPRLRYIDEEDDLYVRDYAYGISLGELLMYHPLPEKTWIQLLRRLRHTLDSQLWRIGEVVAAIDERDTLEMFAIKPAERFAQWSKTFSGRAYADLDEITVNGMTLPAGPGRVNEIVSALHSMTVLAHSDFKLVHGHGDLNFNNIIVDLQTMSFKLVDPRLRWGKTRLCQAGMPLLYEEAKLAYSWNGFCAITHGLFDVRGDAEKGYQFDIAHFCDRREAFARAVLGRPESRLLALLQASLFISALPLHQPREQLPLYFMGLTLAQEALQL